MVQLLAVLTNVILLIYNIFRSIAFLFVIITEVEETFGNESASLCAEVFIIIYRGSPIDLRMPDTRNAIPGI